MCVMYVARAEQIAGVYLIYYYTVPGGGVKRVGQTGGTDEDLITLVTLSRILRY